MRDIDEIKVSQPSLFHQYIEIKVTKCSIVYIAVSQMVQQAKTKLQKTRRFNHEVTTEYLSRSPQINF